VLKPWSRNKASSGIPVNVSTSQGQIPFPLSLFSWPSQPSSLIQQLALIINQKKKKPPNPFVSRENSKDSIQSIKLFLLIFSSSVDRKGERSIQEWRRGRECRRGRSERTTKEEKGEGERLQRRSMQDLECTGVISYQNTVTIMKCLKLSATKLVGLLKKTALLIERYANNYVRFNFPMSCLR